MLRDSRLIAPLSPIQKMKNVQFVIDQRDSGVLLNYHRSKRDTGLRILYKCLLQYMNFVYICSE